MSEIYNRIAEHFAGRRKDREYRNLRGILSPQFAVTAGGETGDLVIGYVQDIATLYDPTTRYIARLWPNGDFDFFPRETTRYNSMATVEGGGLYALSSQLWVLERNTSIKQLGWRYFQHPEQYAGTRETWNSLSYPSGYKDHSVAEAFWHTRRTLLAQARKATAVIAPGAVHYTAASGALRSLEPVLTRSWQPEERKVYQAHMRELKEQVEFRGRLGALGDVAQRTLAGSTFGVKREKSDAELMIAANIEDNDSLRALADRALWRAYPYVTQGTETPHDVVAQHTKRFVINKAEVLRQHLRAVVYS